MMKVKEIIMLASALAGMEDVEKALIEFNNATDKGEEYIFEESISEKINKAIKCINLTTSRIATEYLSLKKEVIQVSDLEGKIPYTNFDESLIEVLAVSDAGSGCALEFAPLPFHIYIPYRNRRVKVVCRYLPREVNSLEDEVSFPEFVTKRVVALGVVSDLLLSANVYDESKFWNEKFEEAIEKSLSKRKVGGLPPRKFM